MVARIEINSYIKFRCEKNPRIYFHIFQKIITHAFQWTKWLKKLSVFKIMVTSMEQLQLEEDSSSEPSFPNQTINLPLIHDTRRISDDSNGGNLSLKKGPMCKIKNYNKKIMIHFLIVKNHNSFFNCKKWQLKNVIWRILRGLNTR